MQQATNDFVPFSATIYVYKYKSIDAHNNIVEHDIKTHSNTHDLWALSSVTWSDAAKVGKLV